VRRDNFSVACVCCPASRLALSLSLHEFLDFQFPFCICSLSKFHAFSCVCRRKRQDARGGRWEGGKRKGKRCFLSLYISHRFQRRLEVLIYFGLDIFFTCSSRNSWREEETQCLTLPSLSRERERERALLYNCSSSRQFPLR
jgi:hypothetical protein